LPEIEAVGWVSCCCCWAVFVGADEVMVAGEVMMGGEVATVL
jgi:hypothetical protein